MKPRLLIIVSHPIQYQVPWFQALHLDDRVDLKVLFLNLPDKHQQGAGFGQDFEWDIPLLEGYEWAVAESASGSILDGWRGLYLRAPKHDIAAVNTDVILVTGWQNLGMLQCIVAAKRLKIPLLIRAESNGLAPQSLLRKLKNWWIVGKASLVLPIGKANRQFYEGLGGKQRIGPDVPYFVDNQFFADHSQLLLPQRERIRQEFGVPTDAFCFLFAGKFVEKKHPQDVLAALMMLGNRVNQPVHLLMVGAGPLESQLKELVSRNKLPVTFAGFLNQTEIPSAYVAADCFVLPSDYGETWGLVVNEAMACGLAAIVSDRVGCGPDLITEGETGFLFQFSDVVDLAEKMQKVTDMSELELCRMGTACKQRVNRFYSIQTAVNGTVAAVQALNSQNSKAVPH